MNFCHFSEEFVAHGNNVNCVALSKKSGRVIVTGGEDRKVNLWIVGKPNCLMVSKPAKLYVLFMLQFENNINFWDGPGPESCESKVGIFYKNLVIFLC